MAAAPSGFVIADLASLEYISCGSLTRARGGDLVQDLDDPAEELQNL